MIIPEWFKKELKGIDPTYRAEVEDGLVCIVKDVSVKLPLSNGGTAIVHGPRTIDVFEHPSANALEKLRKRKYEGLKMNIVENPMNELRMFKALEDDARKKRKELAVDMIAEAMVEVDTIENKRKQSFVMPGGKDGQ